MKRNALLAIYHQYKADGNKYDYKNMQNILNTVTLVANCEGLKENYKDKNQAQNTASQAASYANTAAQYAGALSTLLGAFGCK